MDFQYPKLRGIVSIMMYAIIKQMEHEQLLARGLAALDFDISSGILERLSRYIEEIEQWNALYGLVNANEEDIVIKHVLDSLAPWRILEDIFLDTERLLGTDKKLLIADIGTGAGLPGIPLAIAFPHRSFLLIEKMEKRVRFLENVVTMLGLKNVLIHGIPVEEEREPLSCVVFRALRPFGDKRLFRAIWKKMQVGAVLCAYKGKIINAKLELTGLADDPVLSSLAAHAQIVPVWVPFLEEERCVVISKITRNLIAGNASWRG